MTRQSKLKHKITALVVSCVMVACLMMIGEFLCRAFTRVNFLDNTAEMFSPNRFGKSYGNTPNFSGVSFGQEFTTDANGFRYDAGAGVELAGDSAVLLIGDSVGFGPAVEDSKTIAGRLRARMNTPVHNASVIGYDTFDHKNAASAIVRNDRGIRTVAVIFCLNDVNDASAQQIRNQVGSMSQPQSTASLARTINDYLRSRSKLFVWLKTLLLDSQVTTFRFDLTFYQKGEENVRAALNPLSELKKELDALGVVLKVFVMPYEAQLRASATDADLEPQRLVMKALAAEGIESYDLMPKFKASENTNLLFLYGDPMHLSEEGHAVAAKAVCERLPGCDPSK